MVNYLKLRIILTHTASVTDYSGTSTKMLFVKEAGMTNYELILNGLKEFYKVNDDLRKDLEAYSMENTKRTIAQNIELFAKINDNNDYTQQVIEALNDLNREPHYISEMETMYEMIDDFAYMQQ